MCAFGAQTRPRSKRISSGTTAPDRSTRSACAAVARGSGALHPAWSDREEAKRGRNAERGSEGHHRDHHVLVEITPRYP